MDGLTENEFRKVANYSEPELYKDAVINNDGLYRRDLVILYLLALEEKNRRILTNTDNLAQKR